VNRLISEELLVSAPVEQTATAWAIVEPEAQTPATIRARLPDLVTVEAAHRSYPNLVLVDTPGYGVSSFLVVAVGESCWLPGCGCSRFLLGTALRSFPWRHPLYLLSDPGYALRSDHTGPIADLSTPTVRRTDQGLYIFPNFKVSDRVRRRICVRARAS